MLTMKTRQEIFTKYQQDYQSARNTNRKKVSEILETVSVVTGMTRKSVNRRFLSNQYQYASKIEKRGRKPQYTAAVKSVLHDLWRSNAYACGESLHPMVREYVTILKRDTMWKYSEYTTQKLYQMSLGTMKRCIREFRKSDNHKGKGISSTSLSQLKHIIPIYRGSWRNRMPGTGQIDTVAHCGHILSGDIVYTLDYTDVPVYWTILRAQWNKSQIATKISLTFVREHLPWILKEFHPDTGSEFINWLLKEWCDTVKVAMTRSRPNHSNDNAFVEERNGNIVRKYIGYIRLDCKEAVDALNDVYEVLCLYLNHFRASRRLARKYEVNGKWKKEYEKVAKTPYQRVQEHPDIPEEVKVGLRVEHEKLNPVLLLREVDRRKKILYDVQRKYGKQKV